MRKIAFLLTAATALLSAQVVSIGGAGAGQSLTSPAANTPPEQRCAVQGQVTNAQTGEPLKKANVYLVRRGGTTASMGAMPAQEGYSEVSLADGSFQFDGVEPGEYSLSGERSGFLRTQYGSTSSYGGGTKLTLAPGQHLTKLTLALTPQGVVTGKVVDQDGDPVGGVMIMALRQMWLQGGSRYMPAGNANTDEEGNFRIPNLQPGKYYVCAQKAQFGVMEMPTSPDKPDIRPVRTFYPDSMTRDGATAVAVKPGQTVPGIEIRMRSVATHHIRGKIAAETTGSPDMLPLQVVPDDGDFPFGMTGMNRSKPDHSFDVAGVAPGRYWVSVMQISGKVRTVAEASVEVGASDVNDVVLAATPSGTLHGQITLQGAPAGTSTDVKSVRVTLMPTDHRHAFFPGQSETKENGSFVIQDVSPGKYKVHVYSVPKGAYVQSVQFGSQDVLDKEVDFSQGVSGEFQVALRYGVAEVSGMLVTAQDAGDANAKNKTDASIILIPDSGSGEQTHNGDPDQTSSFSIKEVPPGKYHVIAVEGLNLMLLQNPDFTKALASKGIELELKENDKKQLQVTLTPASDVQQILANLGIDGE